MLIYFTLNRIFFSYNKVVNYISLYLQQYFNFFITYYENR